MRTFAPPDVFEPLGAVLAKAPGLDTALTITACHFAAARKSDTGTGHGDVSFPLHPRERDANAAYEQPVRRYLQALARASGADLVLLDAHLMPGHATPRTQLSHERLALPHLVAELMTVIQPADAMRWISIALDPSSDCEIHLLQDDIAAHPFRPRPEPHVFVEPLRRWTGMISLLFDEVNMLRIRIPIPAPSAHERLAAAARCEANLDELQRF